MSKAVGKRVTKTELFQCQDKTSLEFVSKQLECITCDELVVENSAISEGAATHLLQSVRNLRIRQLALVSLKENSITDPLRLLLDLSEEVQELYLNQFPIGLSRRSNYLFGLRNFDWADIIIEIMSNRRVTKMLIDNNYDRFLSKAGADALKTRLPLTGKA
ncbi:hypothetical protein PENTCL1PPCAC_9759, partial [Pristionchus entomophagus]